MIINQLILFSIYLLSGVALCTLFDFFRSLRKNFKTSDHITIIEDILFWIIAGIILMLIIDKFSYGELRAYPFFGLVIGVSLYYKFMSRFIIKFYSIIIYSLKNIFVALKNIIVKVLLNPIKSIIIRLKKKHSI